MWRIVLVTISIFLVHPTLEQENAGTNVAPALQECYNNTRLSTKDYRPPATINILIDLIRKIENGNPNLNAREISIQILDRFKQDGIFKDQQIVDEKVGLPYSPKGPQSYRNRVLLKQLLPSLPVTMDNNTLNDVERCALHSMISKSTEIFERGDENSACNRIARYTSRLRRDTELMAEQVDGRRSKSDCPIENGVIYTKWGAVTAGDVLAGLAAGIESQTIQIAEGRVENIYGSTIAGQLSEVALYQATSAKVLGNKGGWNSTIIPKYYFLENNEKNNLYLTDAGIRGGLDGLYLGLNYQNIKSRANNVKISQILDLYYSPRGVFNSSLKACNRNINLNDIINRQKLLEQTTAFNYLLDPVAVYTYTPKKESFPDFAASAVNSFYNYVASLADVACNSDDDLSIVRTATDFTIFIDTAWDYEQILSLISYTLDNIDVNKYESSYAIYSGKSNTPIVNRTRSILDFHTKFNRTQQRLYETGFDYKQILQVVENFTKEKLSNDTDVLRGQSTVVLLIPHSSSVPDDSDKQYFRNRRTEVFRKYLPDLRIMVASPNKDSYTELVYNPTSDIVVLPGDGADDNSLKSAANSLVENIKRVPRSVVNPACKSTFSTSQSGSFEVPQYVEPTGINYHKISPQYFASGGENRVLKVKGQGSGTITVCSSRTEPYPKGNNTNVQCKNVISDEYSLNLNGACSGDIVNCNPVYISVEGLQTSQISSSRCNDALCRFPDNLKYTIRLENVGCSSAEKLFASLAIASILFALLPF